MKKTYFSLVLHSHIPYVLDHGSWPHGMDWLFEAAAETYLPLLDVLERLAAEGVSPAVSIGFTPVLMAQLKDPDFTAGFSGYLEMKLGIAAEDRKAFARTGNPLLPLAAFWEDRYRRTFEDFQGRFRGDILGAFRSLQDRGRLEVLTSAATHGYFPLLGDDESIRHQIRQGRHCYRRYFGREARGFWIPECAYRPGYSWTPPVGDGGPRDRLGIDELLAAEGLGYFFADAHLLKGGEAKGVYLDRFPGLRRLWEQSRAEQGPEKGPAGDLYAGYLAYPSRLPFLVRDEVTGSQVWSRFMGYPGDGAYLEFHKKHFPGGLRYWRVTSADEDLALKQPYEPSRIPERLAAHADHFVSVVHKALDGREEGVVAALYDTELFGHWWFEGPEWLALVLRKLSAGTVRPATAGDCLDALPPRSLVSLAEGSWGKGGFHWIWLNEETGWIWKRIYEIESEAAAVRSRPSTDRRLLRQFYREKFLLESSDWPFLISTLTARDYAENRAAEHYARAAELAAWLKQGRRLGPAEEARLAAMEKEDGVFEEVVGPDGTPL